MAVQIPCRRKPASRDWRWGLLEIAERMWDQRRGNSEWTAPEVLEAGRKLSMLEIAGKHHQTRISALVVILEKTRV
jgi:hypothetical protein